MGRGVKRMQEVEEGWAGGCFPREERAAPAKKMCQIDRRPLRVEVIPPFFL